jgi:phenylacetate-CoA ligase
MNHADRFDRLKAAVLEGNRFFADRVRNARTLADIPFTTKSELIEDQVANPPFGTNLTFPVHQYVRMHQTSGTSGKPLVWLDTAACWQWWMRCWSEVYRSIGVQRGDRVYVAFSFGPFIGFWVAFEAAQHMGLMALSGGGQSTEQRLQAIVEREATVLVCTPTYALRLIEVASGMGVDLKNSAIRITLHAGEPGASLPSTREKIQQAFGARTFDHVGMTEMGAYGFECQAQSGLHINEDEFIVEVIDPVSLAPVKEGDRGELVLTNLGRLGMPLLRYRTGDLVVMSRERCACGRSTARLIGGILGRSDDMMTIRGVNIFPSAIENIVRRHAAVVEYAIHVFQRRGMDELGLKVEIDGSADVPETVAALIHDCHRDLHIRPDVECVPANTLPRFELKSRRVVRSS